MTDRKLLELAVIDAALNLTEATCSHAFSLPVANTTPRLFVSLHEEGCAPLNMKAPDFQSLIDASRKLVTAYVVLTNLPSEPGTNGSVLLIDDIECARIASDIEAAIRAVEAITKGQQ